MNKKNDKKTPNVNIAGPVFDGQHRDTTVKRDPELRYIDVTPALAAKYLAKNRRNRPIVDARVEKYAQEMLAGDFPDADSSICVGADGDLYNGQHRLSAVIRSGVTVRMSFKLGVSPAARPKMDIGTIRSPTDICFIETGKRLGRTEAAVYAATHSLKINGNIASMGRTDWSVLNAQHEEHSADLAAVLDAMKDNGRRFMNAAIISVFVITHRTEPAKTLEFCRRLVTGSDLPPKSPILALRDFISEAFPKGRSDAFGRNILNSKTFSAVDAYVLGLDRNYVKKNEGARAKYLLPWRKEDAEK